MRCAITIGAFKLLSFIELNVRSCRMIFGDAPLLIYNGASSENEKVKRLADQFDCSFLSDSINRQHFAGDIQSAVCAIAFGRHVGAEICIKLNQRFIPLSPEIPERLEEIFSDPKIDLAMPKAPRAETIQEGSSKFHSRFNVSPAFIAMRAKAFNPQHIADSYAEQVRNSKNRAETLTEYFWAKMVQNEFKDRWQAIPWLSEPTEPPEYLQKCQHTSEQYSKAAVALGMAPAQFETKEWSAISMSAYQPLPRAV